MEAQQREWELLLRGIVVSSYYLRVVILLVICENKFKQSCSNIKGFGQMRQYQKILILVF